MVWDQKNTFFNSTTNMSQYQCLNLKTSLCLSKGVNSELQIRMIALYAAVKSKALADFSEKKKSRNVNWCILIHFVLFCLFFFSFCCRRCGSLKVKLVLNFSMVQNSVYTIQNFKVFIQYFYRKIAATL